MTIEVADLEWFDIELEDAPIGVPLLFWFNEANEAFWGIVEDDEVYLYNVDNEEGLIDVTVSAWAYPPQ